MYRECSESQRRACCWWPPGGSSGHTRCSTGLCSRLPWRKHQWLSWKPDCSGVVRRGSQHFLLYFGSYNIMWITWDQWFSVSLCKGDRWTWQTRPQGETWGWECGRTGAHSASPGSERRHINKPSTFTTNNVVRKWLRMCAEFSDLGPEEAVALLFYVVVYDTRHFLLPDFKAINADIVLDVFKWPVESIHGGSHFLQLGHELTWLRDKR